jgi:hypothetical protein
VGGVGVSDEAGLGELLAGRLVPAESQNEISRLGGFAFGAKRVEDLAGNHAGPEVFAFAAERVDAVVGHPLGQLGAVDLGEKLMDGLAQS